MLIQAQHGVRPDGRVREEAVTDLGWGRTEESGVSKAPSPHLLLTPAASTDETVASKGSSPWACRCDGEPPSYFPPAMNDRQRHWGLGPLPAWRR